jgi:hypothetical protein
MPNHSSHYFFYLRCRLQLASNSQTAPNPGAPASPPSIAALNQLSRSPNNEIRSRVQILQSDFCNRQAVLRLIGLLHQGDNLKPATDIGEGFLAQCDKDKSIGFYTAQGLFNRSDFNRALVTINQFKDEVTSDPNFASWRGFILEKLNRNLEAAADFERSLYLFGDIKNVRGGPVFRDRMAAWLRWILGLITPPISPALGR